MIRARVIAAGFVIGGAFHLRDIVAGGWMPYRFAPDAMNFFWTMLLPLDLIAAFGPALTIQGAFALLLAAWAPSLWHSASTSPISRA